MAEQLRDVEDAMAASSKKSEGLFLEYLIKGQFPEAQEFSSRNFREYLISSIISKVLEIDIPRLFHIRGVEEIKHLFFSVCRESGSLFQAVSWSQETGLSIPTIDDYLSYLSQAYLISLVSNYSGSLRKGPRTLRKLYVSSPNFITGLQAIEEDNSLFPQVAGVLVETAIFNRLRTIDTLFFWRMREKEIDFVLSHQQSLIPIEVKFRKTTKSRDLSNLLLFLKNSGAPRGVLVTMNEVGKEIIEGKEIIRIPAMALL